jgi:hypothetical protein
MQCNAVGGDIPLSRCRIARFFAVLSAALVITQASGARADDAQPAPPAPNDALNATVARHDDEIARLRREIDDEKRAREEERARARDAVDLRWGGYVQVDAVLHRQSSQDEVNPSTGQPLNEDRVVLRRAHLRGDVERGLVSAALEIDANTVNGPMVRPIDAEVSLRWPEKRESNLPYVMGTLGLMRIPFGFEVPELDNVRPFLERSAVMRALFPGEFDLGVRIKGGYRSIDYALALMNGDPIGEKLFPARDPNGSKDLVGRIGVDTEIVDGVSVAAGLSAVTGMGFHKGTPSTKDVLVWRDVNEDGVVQSTEIQVIAGQAATPSQNFHRFALGADLRVSIRVPVIGKLSLRGEIVRGANLDRGLAPADPAATGRDLRESGWYAGLTQEITRWAIVGVRYDRYNPDLDASSGIAGNVVPTDSTFSTLALMAALRYAKARLVIEYDKNDNALGRNVNGAPTTLKDDALTLRGEVTF